MSEPQQYTLNQSVTIEPGPSEDSVNVWLGNVCLNFPSHLASSVFVPVGSVDNLQQQLLDLFREVSSESFYLGVDSERRDPVLEPFGDKYLMVFVEAVLSLIQPKGHT